MNAIEQLLEQLDALRQELDTYRPIPADRMNRIMQKLRLDWNFNSNSMEGNTLSASETKRLLLYGLTAKGKPFRDHIEMKGHDEAVGKIFDLVGKKIKITETFIKDFHRMIISEIDRINDEGAEINPGEWKTQPNYLMSPINERIDFLPPHEVPEAMSDLINWTNNHLYQDHLNRHKKKKYDLHPLIVACIFHQRFIDIHPFGDGNGRMARIMVNLILMQNGFFPAVVPLGTRKEYYLALNDSTEDDATPLITYMGQQLVTTMELAIEGAKGNSVEEPKDWEKSAAVWKQKIQNREQEILLLERTPENQKQIVENVFIELIAALAPKLEQLSQGIFEGINYQFKNPNNTFLENSTDLIAAIREQQEPNSLYCTFRLNSFKGTETGLDVYIALHLSFDEKDYSLTVYVGNMHLLDLTLFEINRLARQIINTDFSHSKELNLIKESSYNKRKWNPTQLDKYTDTILNTIMKYIDQETQP